MPPKKELPVGIVPGEKNQIRCTICENGAVAEIDFLRKSLARHRKSAEHVFALEALAEREQRRKVQVQAALAASIYSSANSSNNAMLLGQSHQDQPIVSARLPMFPDEVTPDSEILQELPDPWSQMPNIEIPAGMMPQNPSIEHERLRDQYRRLVEQMEHEDFFGVEYEDDATATNVTEQFQDGGWNNDGDDPISDNTSGLSSEFFPYPNRLTMLLDIMDGCPRLRLSGNHFQLILWLLKECRLQNVPSYSGFRDLQNKLRSTCGSEPVRHVAESSGNVFHVNDIRDSIARDFSNPQVAEHLHFYPEEAQGAVSEVWQAERWKEYTPSQLTPMYSNGRCQFYIDELAGLADGRLVIPKNWIVRRGELTADCDVVDIGPCGRLRITDSREAIQAKEFRENYAEIKAVVGEAGICWDEAGPLPPSMPNKLRELAGDEDLYVVMVPLWCDDVSGNKSKQYNKHMNIYMANSNLPGRLLQQEYFVRFVSTSPHATSPEQFAALKAQVRSTETDPIRCFNAKTQRPCRVILRVPALPADNPQQAEEASHTGGNCHRLCRKCKAGGPPAITESDEGYHTLFKSGDLRSVSYVKDQLRKQLETAATGVGSHVTNLQTDTGVKDKITEHWIAILIEKARAMREEKEMTPEEVKPLIIKWLDEQPEDKMNPLLSFEGLDPTQDTPVEVLHTILLGVVKYVWHMLHISWQEADRSTFALRLQSTDMLGIKGPPIRAAYMMQYRNNLIGKNFKTIMQTMVFHMHGIATPLQFELVRAVGELGALIWITEIDDMEQYLGDLTVSIGNVLDAFSDLDPTKIINKVKLHVLTHLPQDIRRFGPAVRSSTEIFECYNAIFRLCSVLSNHQAPSRDIARQFASMDRIKHILSGGYWKQDGQWVRASEKVQEVLRSDEVIQRHMGWVPPRQISPGTVRLKGERNFPPIEWSTTSSSLGECNTPSHITPQPTSHWRRAYTVTSEVGDHCHEHSWVFARKDGGYIIGRIKEIISSDVGDYQPLVCFEPFSTKDELHPSFKMPVLYRSSGPKYLVVPSTAIFCEISVQHDCRTFDCQPTLTRPQRQEREDTSATVSFISHNSDDHFVLNTHAIHNAHLLRQVLARNLLAPQPIYIDRELRHAELSAPLRITQHAKRAERNKKRATAAAKTKAKSAKRKAEMEGVEGPSAEVEEHGNSHEVAGPSNTTQAAIAQEKPKKARKRAKR
ncbi:hypothetical protein BKA70DRAFT_1387014 [Coprinopsis sp. MPI-PUGE-AT-0042]|nr:hypothetical protein BKA70DRAFT_1387014 [Coprinopsis sp. MPI-PUGE-AT-0042]